MPPRLIVNADDFGLTPGVNRAVAELHDAGALPSATLMAVGPAFDDALATAQQRPELGVGCHLVLLDGVPLSSPAEIPTLIGADGRSFRTSLVEFARDALFGRIAAADIAREARAQITKLQAAGLTVTHLDTHKHTHMLPAIQRPLLQVAEELAVPAIRNPFEPLWAVKATAGQRLRRLLVRALAPLHRRFLGQPQIRSGRIQTTGGTVGISATGDLNAESLRTLLRRLPPDGTYELVCHPGYNDTDLDQVKTRLRTEREIELAALLELLSEQPQVPAPHGSGETRRNSLRPTLIHYGDLSRACSDPPCSTLASTGGQN